MAPLKIWRPNLQKLKSAFSNWSPTSKRLEYIYTYYLSYAAKPVELEWVCSRSCGTWSLKTRREATNFNTIQPSTEKKDACEFFLYFFKRIFFCLLLRTNDLNRKCRYDGSQKKHNIHTSSAIQRDGNVRTRNKACDYLKLGHLALWQTIKITLTQNTNSGKGQEDKKKAADASSFCPATSVT